MTLVTVRIMSRIRSKGNNTAMMMTICSGVAPITLSVVAARNRLTDGMPAVPIETSVAIRGQPGYIHTRTSEHLSAITVKMGDGDAGPFIPADDRIHLFTGYFRRDLKLAGDGFARGAIDIRIEPHYQHDGWIRDSRYEGDWIMNDRLHFGIRIGADGQVLLEQRWHPQSNNTRLDVTQGKADIALPGQARRYFESGVLEVWADPWS